jgi:signal transduction histidine kinase
MDASSLPTPQKLERQLATQNRLLEISLLLNSTLAQDALINHIMDAAKELSGAEAASILLIEPHTNDLVFAANSSGGSGDLRGKPVPLEGSIAGMILREEMPVAIDDVSKDPRHYRQLDQQLDFQTRSVLGVPMRIKDKIVGVLEVVNKINGSWTEEDINSVLILAAQAAVAIENAQLITALRSAYDDLGKVDKLKSDFIAIASHELRTPLSVILGYASFLKEEASGSASSHAEAVFRSALQLRNIIEQMTNLRFMQQEDVALEKQVVSVTEMLRAAEQDVMSMVEAKAHHLEVTPPPDDLLVEVDPGRMVTALTNVLNNAVEFTSPEGHIQLSTLPKTNEIWIIVKDNGPGIAARHLEKIFDEFYQVEDHMTRRHGGMGLGLSIARALVQAHNGRIWAESAGNGAGSTFTISLPLYQQA